MRFLKVILKGGFKYTYKLYRKISKYFYTYLAELTSSTEKGKITANGLTLLTKNTVVGKNINFNGLRIYGLGKVTIGSNFHSGRNCKIITDVHDYEGSKIPYDENIIKKDVLIEDNVWLGSEVILLGGVTIGEGAIVQAGSVVVSSVEKLAIVGGHPARKFSQRDREHYYTLKEKKAFH